MKPISVYCKQDVHGWVKLPTEFCLPKPGQEDFTCSFLSESLGIQLLATIEELGFLEKIHVSIAPVKYYRQDLSDEEFLQEIQSNSRNIIKSFFGDLAFCRAPDDPRKTIIKHFFHIIDTTKHGD